jgi:hypothetical protein
VAEIPAAHNAPFVSRERLSTMRSAFREKGRGAKKRFLHRGKVLR